MKKRMTILLTILCLLLPLISRGILAYAAETSNLKMETEAYRKIEMAAGGTRHVKLVLSLKEG